MGDTGLVMPDVGIWNCGLRGCPAVGETRSEERARDIYGRGGFFLGSSGASGVFDGGNGP